MSGRVTEAAQRLSEHAARHGREQLSSTDVEAVRDALYAFLLARYRALGADEVLDVVDEALLRLVETSAEAEEPLEHAAAWLFTVAKNEALTRLRRLRTGDRMPPDELDDDELAMLLDADASRSMVEDGFRRATSAGDHIAIRVVGAWLDLAAELGEAPSSRLVAARSGYSHTTVNDALGRFRSYLGGPEPSTRRGR
jgi:DNA-directed RNA polymerase specialized sigma24 family protein